MRDTDTLLEIDRLSTYYYSRGAEVRAVDEVSLTVGARENLGLVGESGCGKTTLSKSLLRIIPDTARITGGEIRLNGRDIVTLKEAELDRVRWREISMIAQSAMNSLDPVYTAGEQMIETLQVHTGMTRQEAWRRSEELFLMVGLDPGRLRAYPHQLSGGMRQRVVIALALALNPKLIVADEPTTALDVVVQDGIIKQLEEIQKRSGNSIILVTHDVSLVAEMCHRVAVMYAGRLMEVGTTDEVFNHPAHPYTMGLLNAYPTLESARGELVSIPGAPPDLATRIPGCPFAERCPFATELCRTERPPEIEVEPGHRSACHYAREAAGYRNAAQDQKTWEQSAAARKMRAGSVVAAMTAPGAGTRNAAPDRDTPILEINGVQRWFPLRAAPLDRLLRRPRRHVHAVDGVSINVGRAEILGLAGESGSGKSTLGEVITGLQENTGGSLLFEGEPIFQKGRIRPALRRRIQMAFQDPYETLNPRFTVYHTVLEPLSNFEIGSKSDRRAKVIEALTRVELNPPEAYLDRYPHELSGGQRQRVAIARAIVVEPHLLLADEPVSMLDVSIRAGVLNLFRRFRSELGMSIVYVSHDLATIRYICDRTAILYLGRVAEIGPTEEVIENARHPYTRLLLSAVPRANPQAARAHVDARGEIPSAVDLPNGCRFHGRCSRAMEHCGWEGRDVQALLTAAINQETPDGLLLRDSGATVTTDGLDLVVLAGRGNTSSLEAVRAAIEGIMKSTDRPVERSVSEVVTREPGTLRFRFERRPDPEDFTVGDRHRAACLLYAPTDGDAAGKPPL
ncbi:MAG: ABC transporter ATP-binding protein [Spirochaetaceae bacterium]|nr:MAG: ABC transporter ATP-binding protein [Spirochaetaceae bacterium]